MTIAWFVDLEKAHDSVWREGLTVLLHKLGIKGKTWTWINNFLSDRKARCILKEFEGKEFTTSIDLPQGSVISPTLFNIYIKDMMANTTRSNCKFADDGTLWHTGPNMQDIKPQSHEVSKIKKGIIT